MPKYGATIWYESIEYAGSTTEFVEADSVIEAEHKFDNRAARLESNIYPNNEGTVGVGRIWKCAEAPTHARLSGGNDVEVTGDGLYDVARNPMTADEIAELYKFVKKVERYNR